MIIFLLTGLGMQTVALLLFFGRRYPSDSLPHSIMGLKKDVACAGFLFFAGTAFNVLVGFRDADYTLVLGEIMLACLAGMVLWRANKRLRA